MVAMGIMMVVIAAVLSQFSNVFRVSNTTYELTEAQQSLRTAQEFINRDLISTGDGLRGINNIRVRKGFVEAYIATTPVVNPSDPDYVTLPLVTSDNNVPAATVVADSNPTINVVAGSDRLTLLMIDSSFTPIGVAGGDITGTGSRITVTQAQYTAGNFKVGGVYFLNSEYGATFCTLTSMTNITSTNPNLFFQNNDALGLNLEGNSGAIRFVSRGTVNQPVATSLMRMQIIQYFVNANRVLIRRVFGTRGNTGYTDSIIADNITDFQARYFLNDVPQPVAQLATAEQQVAVRQIEVTVEAQTAHAVINGGQQKLSAKTMTSIRNLQFRKAL
jgi:hypothetical protein